MDSGWFACSSGQTGNLLVLEWQVLGHTFCLLGFRTCSRDLRRQSIHQDFWQGVHHWELEQEYSQSICECESMSKPAFLGNFWMLQAQQIHGIAQSTHAFAHEHKAYTPSGIRVLLLIIYPEKASKIIQPGLNQGWFQCISATRDKFEQPCGHGQQNQTSNFRRAACKILLPFLGVEKGSLMDLPKGLRCVWKIKVFV